MFRLVVPETIDLPVLVSGPDGAEGEITVTIRYRGMKECVAYLRRLADEGVDDREMLDDTVVGWTGIEDADGRPLSYGDPEARERVLDVPWLWRAIRDAVIDELVHRDDARKN